jgi:hypothetical protein
VDARVTGPNLAKAIKILSTPFFRWKVKPETSCHKILYKKSLESVNEIFARQNPHFFRPFLLLAPR